MRKKRRWIIPLLILLLLAAGFFLYTGIYYHAAPEAAQALSSDSQVTVTRMEYGWFFDGPSEESALVFYPGGKVEASAYAPFLHRLAKAGMDAFLVEMPFRLAVFSINKADQVIQKDQYENWYSGGHSLGGAMAAYYAASHPDALTGVILLGAYLSKPLDDRLTVISLHGSEDYILNLEKAEKGKTFAEHFYEKIIEGGNHAGFGNYGEQSGDGKAGISAEDQQKQAVAFILQMIQ